MIQISSLFKMTLLIVISLLLSDYKLYSQSDSVESHHHHIHTHKNEIGIANMGVYFVNEKLVSYGLHVHFLKQIKQTRFSFGLGFEKIFDEHKHNTVAFVFSYKPIDRLSISISPGISFEKANAHLKPAFHFESSYEFEYKNFHFGPLIEFAYDPEDFHISFGLHTGYGF